MWTPITLKSLCPRSCNTTSLSDSTLNKCNISRPGQWIFWYLMHSTLKSLTQIHRERKKSSSNAFLVKALLEESTALQKLEKQNFLIKRYLFSVYFNSLHYFAGFSSRPKAYLHVWLFLYFSDLLWCHQQLQMLGQKSITNARPHLTLLSFWNWGLPLLIRNFCGLCPRLAEVPASIFSGLIQIYYSMPSPPNMTLVISIFCFLCWLQLL